MLKFVAAIFAVMASSAYAECEDGSETALQLAEWKAEPRDIQGSTRTHVYFEFESTLGRPVIATDGQFSALDPLGRELFTTPIPEVSDPANQPNIVFEGTYGGVSGFDSLAKLPRETVTFSVCTREVAYADGTTEKF